MADAEVGNQEQRTDGRPAPLLTFDDFFAAHFGELVGALGVAVGPEAAADAVQEAFVRAHGRWRRLASMDHPLAYVRRIAINRLIDEHRRQRRWERARPVLVERDDPHASVADIDLARALAQLPRGQRLAVVLHYLLDLPVDDVASELHVSPGTVKSQLHDARRALRRTLEVLDG